MNPVSVLIVDDSALMRSLIGKIIETSETLVIANKAMNGRFALQKLSRSEPDVIVLDIEMPEMNGIEFLKERKKLGIEIPVIVLSSVAKEGARITMECLELGASDFITKPSGSDSANIHTVAKQLVELLTGYGRQYQRKKAEGRAKELPRDKLAEYESTFIQENRPEDRETVTLPRETIASLQKAKTRIQEQSRTTFERTPVATTSKPVPLRAPGAIEIIVIGISTGGPNALRDVFSQIDPDLPQPILVVQHMPAGFTEEFANSLNRICPLEVKEAADGDLIKPGRILIAPGNRHLEVVRKSLATIARITDEPAQNGHRPSVDVLFDSVAREFKNHALGIIMTGMGKDGAAKIRELYYQGSRTIGQDEKSSVVYGMPRVAWEMGGVMEQVSLSEMANTINQYAQKFRS
ncbi:MAG TPA: chemotaxis response regulator protein-glutamate methylesterase [Treponema sp.]|nr:chemotaxis response regulator protein-glutamate methylesterase [Treponema sp.]